MPAGKAVVAAIFLCGALTAHAETRLFLRSEPNDTVGLGQVKVFSSADGAFTASSDRPGSLSVFFSTRGFPGTYWHLGFEAPYPAVLVPGTYTAPSHGSFYVFGEGRSCGGAIGRFVVHELVRDLTGALSSFAVDFEQRCEPGAPALFGSLRLRSGDTGCTGVAPGASCDDHDLCTTDDRCTADGCVGTDAVSATCPPSDACHVAALCDPATAACAAPDAPSGTPCGTTPAEVCVRGACLSCGPVGPCVDIDVDRTSGRCFMSYKPYGATCDDGDPCTVGERCEGGVECRSDTVVDCDDRNPCTADTCDGSGGCAHEPIANCWGLAGRAVGRGSGSGSVAGRSVVCTSNRCEEATRGALVLNPDGSYRSPSTTAGTITCPSSSVVLPDEVGTVRKGRKGRLMLRPSNLGEIRNALRQCTGRRLRIRQRSWVKLLPDGQSLTGSLRVHVTVVDRIPIHVGVVEQIVGRLGSTPPPLPLRIGRSCADLDIRCTVH